jgi:uncharacterized membrane protein YphA (DoxX/SURF4 family)
MAGSMKTFQYEKAKAQMKWVNAVPRGLVTFVGIVEILGAVGLILPALTGILPVLTPLAAVGLVIVMLLASGFHATRGEYQGVVANLILFALSAFVVYGRLVLVPLA